MIRLPHAASILITCHATLSAVRRLVAHSKELGVDPSLLAFIAELNGQMLLLQPLELRARVMLLESALQLNNEQEVLELAKKHPNLLTK